MSQAGLEVFDSTLQKTHLWLNELEELAHLPDQHTAFKVLRAVLHALRDRLPVDVAAHLGAQLPMLIRGFFYEGYRPAGKPLRIRSQDEFLEEISAEIIGPEAVDPLRITHCVFELLNRHLSPGEPVKIRKILPHELQALWPEPSPVFR
ncbi:MAG: DUF2267 domain-containing protein [Verrucomicrobiota bacterium]